jgi:hypothetical protein
VPIWSLAVIVTGPCASIRRIWWSFEFAGAGSRKIVSTEALSRLSPCVATTAPE